MDINSTDSYGLTTDYYTTYSYALTTYDYGLATDVLSAEGRWSPQQTMATNITITMHSLMVAMGGVGNVARIIAFMMDNKLRSRLSSLIIYISTGHS